MRSEEEASRAIDLYGDTVKRICMLHLKNYSDTEDIFQTVFLKYVLHAPVFDSSEHERAWIIRVTINACKDLLKSQANLTQITVMSWKPSCLFPQNIRMLFISIITKNIPLQRSAGFFTKM